MNFYRKTDVAVIGDRITGKAILDELSKYYIECLLVDQNACLLSKTDRNHKEAGHSRHGNQDDAQIIRDCTVTGFVKEDGDVTVVNTTKGSILAEVVIRVDEIQKSGILMVHDITEIAMEAVRKKIDLLEKCN